MSVLFSLCTKRRNKIDVLDKILPPSPEELEEYRHIFYSRLGIKNERTDPDSSYNCHGFTFISKAGNVGTGSDEEWILPLPGEEDYREYNYDANKAQLDVNNLLNDRGTRLKARLSNLEIETFTVKDNIIPGDIVIYKQYFENIKSISHSGIVYKVNKCKNAKVNIKVWSKIGIHQGEYFHDIANPYIVELYGGIVEIWSDGKI